MMLRRITIACLVLTAACGQESTESTSATAPPAAATPTAAPAAPAMERQAAPAGAYAYFIEPADGAVVSSPVHVVFGLSGMGVSPAGFEHANAGHHHLLIDTDLPDLDAPIPSDANHRHFGGGQTEADIELEPGTHTLQLLLGDYRHVPFDPPVVSERITIEVR
jgi:hypothetical protein